MRVYIAIGVSGVIGLSGLISISSSREKNESSALSARIVILVSEQASAVGSKRHVHPSWDASGTSEQRIVQF